jgi:hypothetical protein
MNLLKINYFCKDIFNINNNVLDKIKNKIKSSKDVEYVKTLFNICNMYFIAITSDSFVEVLSIYKDMCKLHGSFLETLKCFAWLCFLIELNAQEEHLLTIIELYDNFYTTFNKSPYKAFVLECIAKYLIRINLAFGNLDYINFIDTIYTHMQETDEIYFEKKINELKLLRQINIVQLITPFAESPQFTFAISQSKSFLENKDISTSVKIYTFILLINIFLSLQLDLMAYTYYVSLKNNYSQYFNLIDADILKNFEIIFEKFEKN